MIKNPELEEIYFAFEKEGFEITDSEICNNILTVKARIKRDPELTHLYDFIKKIRNNLKGAKNSKRIFNSRHWLGKKTEEYSRIIISILIKPGFSKKTKDNVIGKLIRYIDKYNIDNINNLVTDLTHVTRDLNRYIKINKKRELYNYKKTFIKFLYINDYIESIEKHKYGNNLLALAKTKIDDISFHLIPPDLRRIELDFDDLPDGGETKERKTYTENDIKNEEKIFEALPILNQMNNSNIILSAKNIFGEI